MLIPAGWRSRKRPLDKLFLRSRLPAGLNWASLPCRKDRGLEAGTIRPQKRLGFDCLDVESQQWVYQSNKGVCIVSVDSPFSTYHQLQLCYTRVGWTLDSLDQLSLDPATPVPITRAILSEPVLQRKGILHYAILESNFKHMIQEAQVAPPSGPIERIKFALRPPTITPCFQVQVFVQMNDEPTPDEISACQRVLKVVLGQWQASPIQPKKGDPRCFAQRLTITFQKSETIGLAGSARRHHVSAESGCCRLACLHSRGHPSRSLLQTRLERRRVGDFPSLSFASKDWWPTPRRSMDFGSNLRRRWKSPGSVSVPIV